MYFLDYAIKLRSQTGLFYSCRVCGLLFGSCVPGQGICVDKEQPTGEYTFFFPAVQAVCHPYFLSPPAPMDALSCYSFFPVEQLFCYPDFPSSPAPFGVLSCYPFFPAAQAVNESDHEPRDTEKIKQAKQEASRRYRAKNPEKVKESNRESNRRYREKNPEKAREACRRYRAKKKLSVLREPMDALSRYPFFPAAQTVHESNHEPRDTEKVKEANRESNRRYRAKNSEKAREACRRYREKNPEKVKEANRESNRRYREKNPEKAREACRRYRAKKKLSVLREPMDALSCYPFFPAAQTVHESNHEPRDTEKIKQAKREASRRYRAKNPEKAREACRRSRAKKKLFAGLATDPQ